MLRLPVTCALVGVIVVSATALSQTPTQTGTPATAPLPPATKLEAFKPAAGTLVTFGYNDLGRVNGVSVDVREMRGAQGTRVRGVVVEVTQSQYREERAFVDSDELDELLRGIDALLAVKENPTTFQNFEIRYTTKGELQITAFNSSSGRISYAVRAGRIATAQVFVDEDDLRKLRGMFATAREQLVSQGSN